MVDLYTKGRLVHGVFSLVPSLEPSTTRRIARWSPAYWSKDVEARLSRAATNLATTPHSFRISNTAVARILHQLRIFSQRPSLDPRLHPALPNLPLLLPHHQHLRLHQEIYLPALRINLNHIPILHQRHGPPVRGFRPNFPIQKPKTPATEPAV